MLICNHVSKTSYFHAPLSKLIIINLYFVNTTGNACFLLLRSHLRWCEWQQDVKQEKANKCKKALEVNNTKVNGFILKRGIMGLQSVNVAIFKQKATAWHTSMYLRGHKETTCFKRHISMVTWFLSLFNKGPVILLRLEIVTARIISMKTIHYVKRTGIK